MYILVLMFVLNVFIIMVTHILRDFWYMLLVLNTIIVAKMKL